MAIGATPHLWGSPQSSPGHATLASDKMDCASLRASPIVAVWCSASRWNDRWQCAARFKTAAMHRETSAGRLPCAPKPGMDPPLFLPRGGASILSAGCSGSRRPGEGLAREPEPQWGPPESTCPRRDGSACFAQQNWGNGSTLAPATGGASISSGPGGCSGSEHWLTSWAVASDTTWGAHTRGCSATGERVK
jgi:hypothetical protein